MAGASIVLVGDVDAFGPALEAADLGRLVIEPDDVVGAPGPAPAAAAVGADEPADDLGEAAATDAGPDVGPTAGAEEPSLPGPSDDPASADDGDPEPA